MDCGGGVVVAFRFRLETLHDDIILHTVRSIILLLLLLLSYLHTRRLPSFVVIIIIITRFHYCNCYRCCLYCRRRRRRVGGDADVVSEGGNYFVYHWETSFFHIISHQWLGEHIARVKLLMDTSLYLRWRF